MSNPPPTRSLFDVVNALKDEQERVQKKTFTKWMNTHLIMANPPVRITDLYEDIKSGIILLKLLEILGACTLPKEEKRIMQRVHFLSNIRRALEYLEAKKVRLVNINAADIVDGKPSIIMGLIWTIILHFQIEENDDLVQATIKAAKSSGADITQIKGASAKQTMLAWTEHTVSSKYNVPVKDFGPSWRDGKAFSAMVHNIDPSIINMDELETHTNQENLENAFNAAEVHLGIPRLLDAEDVDVDKPDEKSIITYVAQFMKIYPEGSASKKPKLMKAEIVEPPMVVQEVTVPLHSEPVMKSEAEIVKAALAKEKRDLEDVRRFLRDTNMLIAPLISPVENVTAEIQRLEDIMQEQNKIFPQFEDLCNKRSAQTLLTLSTRDIEETEEQWSNTEQKLRQWKWKLDAALPGELGNVGRWVSEAEQLLFEELPLDASNKDLADTLSQRLQNLKKLFRESNIMKQKLSALKQSNLKLSSIYVNDMENRFVNVINNEAGVSLKWGMQQSRCALMAYLELAEEKLKLWTQKYGTQYEVTGLFDDYKKTIIQDNLLQALENSHSDFKAKINQQHDSGDMEQQFLTQSWEKLTKLSKEIKFVQPMLEEMTANWNNFVRDFKIMNDWITESEQQRGMTSSPSSSGSDSGKDSLLSKLDTYATLHRDINDYGNFIIENSQNEVALSVKNQILHVNRRWKDFYDDIKKHQILEESERFRRDYRNGVKSVSEWLEKTEQLLSATMIPCTKQDVKQHLALLDEAALQQDNVENEFKLTSKIAQNLVTASSTEVINEMLGHLKLLKERLVKARKDIPEQARILKHLVPNIESVESGIADLNAWISKGEELLIRHANDEDVTANVAEQLAVLQNHFSEASYYKSLLESKEKMMQKILLSAPKNVNTATLQKELRLVEQRFLDLRERVLRGKYRVPFYMSTDCENLLKKMLVLNPTKRLPLDVIMKDKWMNMGYEENPLIPYTEPTQDYNDIVRIKIMLTMGFSRDEIFESLTKHKFDNVTSTYLLLGKRNYSTEGSLDGGSNSTSNLSLRLQQGVNISGTGAGASSSGGGGKSVVPRSSSATTPQ